MPDSESLARYYDEDYYGSGEGKFLGPVEVATRFFRYIRARAVRRFIPTGRVLDVGCGRGVMIKFLKRWGYQVDGVELDTIAAVRARKNLNQEIFLSLEDLARLPAKHYQAICFWHSLEHLPEPGKALKTADRLLAPGGLLIIAAPHMESLQSRLSGPSWLHLDLPRHLVHFDMKQLAAFLQAKGYRLIRHQHFSQEYNVIDTLCYLYTVLGFGHLYPFDLIRGTYRHGGCTWKQALKTVLGISCLLPLGGLAFCVANLFSLVKSGSTTTLFLKKSVLHTKLCGRSSSDLGI
ncbi:MAG: class I SAM-dependent methyltransferase [Desulfobacterales bacterium]|nr:class I SAM-dependent methyltransferase [Desulfobacterales bacterium]